MKTKTVEAQDVLQTIEGYVGQLIDMEGGIAGILKAHGFDLEPGRDTGDNDILDNELILAWADIRRLTLCLGKVQQEAEYLTGRISRTRIVER